MSTNGQNVGKIVEIKGVVIDAVFPGQLPEIYNAVSIPCRRAIAGVTI
jgi:F0F1-type ATP synthase beta subunit